MTIMANKLRIVKTAIALTVAAADYYCFSYHRCCGGTDNCR